MQAPQFGFDPAAMYLPAKEILSLEVTDRGGESWSSIDEACGPMKGVEWGIRARQNRAGYISTLTSPLLERSMAYFRSASR
jgi:hypothetical protein